MCISERFYDTDALPSFTKFSALSSNNTASINVLYPDFNFSLHRNNK